MRWAATKNGDKRARTRFLFFPKAINHVVRWLEFAKWEEEYMYGWTAKRWLWI